MLTRMFDERHTFARLTLLVVSGIGYLALRGDTMNRVDVAFAVSAFVAGYALCRWPLVNLLGQAAVFQLALLFGHASPVVPEVGAGWALIELALRSPGRRPVYLGALLLCDVRLSGEHIQVPDTLPRAVYSLAINVGVPLLLGLNIRAVRQLALQAEERAAEQQRRRQSETRAVRAGERTAIARELHDLLAHHVASMVLRVGVARHVLPQTDPRVTEVFDDLHATGTAVLADLRQLVAVLRDPATVGDDPALASIEPSALPAALRAAVDRTGLAVAASIDPAVATLDGVRGLAVLRLTQEALTNVAKHAGPGARARLTVAVADGAVRWEVSDAGGAVRPTASPAPGHGLTGMRERVEILGGTLEAGPAGDGWRVRTELPLSPAVAATATAPAEARSPQPPP